jgi:WD40 repeat protein
MRIYRDGDQISIRMWELESGKRVHQFSRRGMVPTLAFSPDGKVLMRGDYKQGNSNLESISLLDLGKFYGKGNAKFVWHLPACPVIRVVAEITLPRSGHGSPFEKWILKL